MIKLPDSTPRMRVFAGPNGSGKSWLKKSLLRPELIGVYINPDEIERVLNIEGFLDFKNFKIEANLERIISHFSNSFLLKSSDYLTKYGSFDCSGNISFQDQKLRFVGVQINSYLASVVADFIRNELIERQENFSFETVMSSSDKIEVLKRAKSAGFKTYLYFIGTRDPRINIDRIKERVIQGGHHVPDDKVISRYYRSLDLLKDAVENSNRSYIFDNSEYGNINNPPPMLFIAEGHDGEILDAEIDEVPDWFDKYWIRKTAPF